MSFQNYLEQIQGVLNDVLSSGSASLIEFQAERRSATGGFFAGVLQFDNGSQLHFREYIDTAQAQPRLMYAYHFQDVASQLIFRYDNAAHRPTLSQLEHKHTIQGVELTTAPT